MERCAECGCFLADCNCDDYEYDDFDCTICGGDGTCMDNSDPLWDCDELPHACHACRGTGRRKDQRYF